MNHSLLQGSRIQLVNQLVYLDEEKSNFLEQYFPVYDKERIHMEQLLTSYCEVVEQVIGGLDEGTLNSVALIGSQVRLRYVEDGFTESFTLVHPDQADPEVNRISFLSPMGKQLLMSKADGILQLEVPLGKVDVNIEEIKYMNDGEVQRN